MIKEVQELTTQLENLSEIRNQVIKTMDDVYDERDKLCDPPNCSDEVCDLITVYDNQGMHLESIIKLLKKIGKECKHLRELAEVYPELFK